MYMYMLVLYMYMYLQPSYPLLPPPQVSFVTQFPFPVQQSPIVKSCSLVAVPPVSNVNVTTPTSQWTVMQGAGNLAVLSLDMQLNWMPPAANITSYNLWVGTQPIASGQSSQLSGEVQSFQVRVLYLCTHASRSLVYTCIRVTCAHMHQGHLCTHVSGSLVYTCMRVTCVHMYEGHLCTHV